MKTLEKLPEDQENQVNLAEDFWKAVKTHFLVFDQVFRLFVRLS